MNNTLLISALFATLSLVACERATVVTPAPATVVIPGPPGPAGATGTQGATGESGSGTTIIVTPPASAPAN